MINLIFENNQDKLPVTDEYISTVKAVCEAVLEEEEIEYDAEISVTIVDGISIKELNALHRNNDTETDVLSFPMLEFEGGYALEDSMDFDGKWLILGDIVLNIERVTSQSIEYGHNFMRELGFLTAHSMLHLLGYDHETGEEDERIMREKEEKILSNLSLFRS